MTDTAGDRSLGLVEDGDSDEEDLACDINQDRSCVFEHSSSRFPTSLELSLQQSFANKSNREKRHLIGRLVERKDMATLPVDYTVGKIVSLLEKEVSLLGGIKYELIEIKNELVSMRSFLDDAERKRICQEGEKAWVENVRDIAYDVEDIIDEVTYHVNRPQPGHKFLIFLHRTIQTPKNIWVKHDIAKRLRGINTSIKAISERRQRYGVDRIEGTNLGNEKKWVQNHGESSFFINEDELLGIKDDKEMLLRWLIHGGQQRSIISIVGMGGSGKTCLVAQVYNNPAVKQQFNCYAWVSVSQNYVIEDLLKNMIMEFYQAMRHLIPMDLSSMSYRELVGMLVNLLKQTRYLIVFDDVWHINFWSEIKYSLPDCECGSRVLLTTRKEDIAFSSFGVRSYVHFIKPLRKEDAWVLFCMKAFSSNPNKCCPPELQTLARDMVEKCAGLPLAIVALSGLMASKRLEVEWRNVFNSLNWELSNNPMLEIVKSVLLLSFHDLPHQLKQCFLYCSIFPEDGLIRRNRLIRLWMAEGFVEEIKGLMPEEVGESYLMELSRRSMLQVLYTRSGKVKACRMHDLMRELAISICKRQNFCQLYRGQVIGEKRVRRVSIEAADMKLASWTSMSQLRSLHVHVTGSLSSTPLYSLPLGFRLLRVLEVEFVPIKRLPEDIGNLFNLRYLNLKGTCVEELPKSIERICNLQTLNLYQTQVKELPYGLVKLQKLRYLIASHYNVESADDFNYASGAKVPPAIGKLKNLQVLHFVEMDGEMTKHVKNLTQLTCLGISSLRDVSEKALCSSIENMHFLCHLSVMVSKEDEVLAMDALSSPPPHLRRLNLIGMLKRVPHWFLSLQNLTALYLSWSRLNEDPLPYIQNLPRLRKLTLINAYVGKKLCFLSGFFALQSLIFRNFPQLEEIVIEKGVMPNIQNLWLSKCMALKMLPHGIEYLANVQQLCLLNVSEELINRIHSAESVDYPRIRHIPKISHYYETPAGWFYEGLP